MADANLLIAGIGWPRFPYEVLQHALKGDYILVLSPSTIEDARKYIVTASPAKAAALETFLSDSDYEQAADPSLEQVAANINLVRDPKDVPVALAAINTKVDLLVTQDKDFTDRDESTKALHEKLTIMLPGTFLRERMGWTSEELEAIRNRSWEDMG